MLVRLLLVALFAIAPAAAQDIVGFHPSKTTDFAADGRAERFDGGSRVIAEGNVVVSQPGVVLKADKMDATIDLATNAIVKIIATGNVRYATVAGDAIAGQQAVYDAELNTFTVTEDVVLLQDGQVATGEQLIYNTVTGAATMTAGPDGRVRGLIPSKQGD